MNEYPFVSYEPDMKNELVYSISGHYLKSSDDKTEKESMIYIRVKINLTGK
jgi:hypothetical protein